MEKKILFFVLCAVFFTAPCEGQMPDYYTRTVVEREGYSYNYDCLSGCTIYNSNSEYVWESMYTRGPGPVPLDIWDGRTSLTVYNGPIKTMMEEKVDKCFSWTESKIFDGQQLEIVLLINTDTGEIRDVVFETIERDPDSAKLPVEIYRRMELALKSSAIYEITDAGRLMTYAIDSWSQYIGDTQPAPPPVYPNGRMAGNVVRYGHSSGGTYAMEHTGELTAVYNNFPQLGKYLYSPPKLADGSATFWSIDYDIKPELKYPSLVKSIGTQFDLLLGNNELPGMKGTDVYIALYVDGSSGKVMQTSYTFKGTVHESLFPQMFDTLDISIKSNSQLQRVSDVDYYVVGWWHRIGTYSPPPPIVRPGDGDLVIQDPVLP